MTGILDTVMSTMTKGGGTSSGSSHPTTATPTHTDTGGQMGGHTGGNTGGNQGGGTSSEINSFDLTKVAKDLKVDSSIHYNGKNYNDNMDSEKDKDSEISKSAFEHESGGEHQANSQSEHKYSGKAFGGESTQSEKYLNDVSYNEKIFDAEFSLDKSFDSLSTSQDNLIGMA